MARINYEIPEPVHQALREQSAKENRSQKEILIEALEDKVGKVEEDGEDMLDLGGRE